MEEMKREDKEMFRLRDISRMRFLRPIQKSFGSVVKIDGKTLINFSSNNYLGLAQDWRLKIAAVKAIFQDGCGAGSSRLLSGTRKIHERLEKELADIKLCRSCLVFPTGYMANIGAICSFAGPGDLIILDKLNHASIIDASLLSGARIKTYRHRDMIDLEKVLKESSQYKRRLLVTESVFSMEGDIAPLPEISRLCRLHNTLVMIDEAHATGVLGERGFGALEYFGMKPGSVDIIVGTLSKALGGQGGFVCADQTMIDYLINKARPFIYTTGLNPASCASALKAVDIIKKRSHLREKLWQRHDHLLRALLKVGIKPTSIEFPICSIITGEDTKTVKISQGLIDAGIYAPGIRPPTVPEGQGRIRLSLMSSHTLNQIERVAEALARLMFEMSKPR